MERENGSIYNEHPYSLASLTIISVILTLIIVITIVGNIFVMLAYIRDPRIRANVANLLFINLAITDLIVGVFSLTLNLARFINNYWPYGEVICKLWSVLDYTACWMSMIVMVVISWDRYCLVSMGLKYKTYQTKKRILLILVTLWTIVAVSWFVIAFAWSSITGQYNIDYSENCNMEFVFTPFAPLAINVIPFSILLSFVVIFNITVYVNIYRRSKGRRRGRPKIKHQAQVATISSGRCTAPEESGHTEQTEEDEIPHTLEAVEIHIDSVNNPKLSHGTDNSHVRDLGASASEKERITLTRHRKAAIVLGILTGCFILFWSPYIITTVFFSICGGSCVNDTMWAVAEALAWFNSSINPLIYAATNVHFRQNFRQFLFLDRFGC